MIIAVILVGGLGTRLRSALSDLPKPMAPIRGHPFLECLVAQLKDQDNEKIVLCVGHRAEKIDEHFGDGARFSVRIEDNNKLRGFIEKGEASGAGWINAGYYAVNRRVLQFIPEGEICSLERDVFPRLLAKQELFAFKNQGAFIDIGLPEEWTRAQALLPVKIKL